MRKIVQEGYEKGHYEKTYKRTSGKMDPFAGTLCDELINLSPGKKILDLGCGVGLPFDKYFIGKGLDVTGIDFSSKHIEKARKNVPSGKFILGDFTKDISGKYDAIISFFALFHIPRKEHKKLLRKINSMLKKNGSLLITLGVDSMECDVNDNFAGAPMAWSSYDIATNKKMILDSGFEIILCAEDYRTERHLWVLARKK